MDNEEKITKGYSEDPSSLGNTKNLYFPSERPKILANIGFIKKIIDFLCHTIRFSEIRWFQFCPPGGKVALV